MEIVIKLIEAMTGLLFALSILIVVVRLFR
jgi:hypothetical protein